MNDDCLLDSENIIAVEKGKDGTYVLLSLKSQIQKNGI